MRTRADERSLMLAVVTLAACLPTLLIDSVLTGPDAMNGSARGTALVIVVLALPVLVISTVRSGRGTIRAEIVLTGTTAYLLYNAVMLVFATPFNRLFLLYVAMLGLAIWSLAERSTRLWRRAARTGPRAPRWVAAYIAVVVVLNALAWLGRIVPAVAGDHPSDVLDGTGVMTNPVFVQDLAFWLPAMAWLAVGVWRDDRSRVVLAAAGTAFWVLESVGVAVDQWWGHAADPSSPVASASMVPVFLVLAALSLGATLALLRTADHEAARTCEQAPEQHPEQHPEEVP